jgi:L-serine dehydratase
VKLNIKNGEKAVEVIGESRGGGLITIAQVNGFRAGFSAQLHMLIITAEDVKGSIAFIADVVAHDECNIASMSVSRKGKNDLACQFIEMDSSIRPITLEYLRSLRWVKEVIYIPEMNN